MNRAVHIAILVLLLSISGTRLAMAMRGLELGDQVKDYELTLLDGTQMKVSELSGEKGLLMIFWATWSERSRNLLTFAESSIAPEFRDKGINLVGINIESVAPGESEMAMIRKVVKSLELSFPMAIDEGLVIFDEIGVITNPTTVLLDSGLVAQGTFPGFPSIAKDEIPAMVKAYLGIEEKKPSLRDRYFLTHKPKNNALLRYNLGKTLYRRYLSLKGELKKAPPSVIRQLNISLERDPDFYSPYLLKAIIYHKTGDESLEDKILAVIKEKDFREFVERIDLAYMYLLTGKKDRSLELLSDLEEEAPDEREVMLLRAILEVQGGKDPNPGAFAALAELERGRKEFSFDIAPFIDGKTGGLIGDPLKSTRLMAEKILEISKVSPALKGP